MVFTICNGCRLGSSSAATWLSGVAIVRQAVAEMLPGVDQYAVLKAAEAFEAIPRLLAESAGLNATGKLMNV